MENEEIKSSEEQTETLKPASTLVENPITMPVINALHEFFKNPFNIKPGGEPFLTAEDVGILTAKMTKIMDEEVSDKLRELEEEFSGRVEDAIEEFKAKVDGDIGLSYAETEQLIEYLVGYREHLKGTSSELLTIELKQFEFKITEKIQKNKYW